MPNLNKTEENVNNFMVILFFDRVRVRFCKIICQSQCSYYSKLDYYWKALCRIKVFRKLPLNLSNVELFLNTVGEKLSKTFIFMMDS